MRFDICYWDDINIDANHRGLQTSSSNQRHDTPVNPMLCFVRGRTFAFSAVIFQISWLCSLWWLPIWQLLQQSFTGSVLQQFNGVRVAPQHWKEVRSLRKQFKPNMPFPHWGTDVRGGVSRLKHDTQKRLRIRLSTIFQAAKIEACHAELNCTFLSYLHPNRVFKD